MLGHIQTINFYGQIQTFPCNKLERTPETTAVGGALKLQDWTVSDGVARVDIVEAVGFYDF